MWTVNYVPTVNDQSNDIAKRCRKRPRQDSNLALYPIHRANRSYLCDYLSKTNNKHPDISPNQPCRFGRHL